MQKTSRILVATASALTVAVMTAGAGHASPAAPPAPVAPEPAPALATASGALLGHPVRVPELLAAPKVPATRATPPPKPAAARPAPARTTAPVAAPRRTQPVAQTPARATAVTTPKRATAPAPKAAPRAAAAPPRAAAPAAAAAPTSAYSSNAEKLAWFNAYVAVVDPAGKGVWHLDLAGTRTTATNRGNTFPGSYGKSTPTVYIYGGGTFNPARLKNTMWHEATHVLQVHDVGYTRSSQLFGGVPGMEAVAVCSEHLMGVPRPGWGCTAKNMAFARDLWAGRIS